jgi:hypothetical protein
MNPEDPQFDPSDKSISRRRMLKRIGAGAAVAWSAPILRSIRMPAFAQDYGGCSPCGDILCFGANECGGKSTCICIRTTEGDCFCGVGQCSCGAFGVGTTSADCTTPGTRCVVVCCTGALQCAAPCGTCSTQTKSSGKTQGQR